jgi:hypothetical protein
MSSIKHFFFNFGMINKQKETYLTSVVVIQRNPCSSLRIATWNIGNAL